MDANSAPGAIPAASNIEKALQAPAQSAPPGDSINSSAKAPESVAQTVSLGNSAGPIVPTGTVLSEPAKLPEPRADAPKPVSVEDVPDKDGPSTTTDADTAKAVPEKPQASEAAPSTAAEKINSAVANEPSSNAGGADNDNNLVTDKPALANGSSAPNDVQMTGAIEGAWSVEPKDDAAVAPSVDPAPPGSGEREAAPQPIAADQKLHTKPATDRKRKAVELEADDAALIAVDGADAGDANREPQRRKPGRPPSKPNGDSNREKDGLGHKLLKKTKKVLPTVGRTERKTRSQGPA